MGKKKRLAAIADAVTDILGSDIEKKKLKKKKALRRFLDKMVLKHQELCQMLEDGVPDPADRKRIERHIATLEEQIGKALEIRKEME